MAAFPSTLIAPITAYFIEHSQNFIEDSRKFSGATVLKTQSRISCDWCVVWRGLGLRRKRRKGDWIWLDEAWCSHVWTIVGISPIQPSSLVNPRMAWWGIGIGSEFLSRCQANAWSTTEFYPVSCTLSLKLNLFFQNFASSFQTWILQRAHCHWPAFTPLLSLLPLFTNLPFFLLACLLRVECSSSWILINPLPANDIPVNVMDTSLSSL